MWGHWDAVWYLQIANHGCTDNHLAAFPPLPPLVVGGLARITHVDTLIVGLVVAFIVGVIACVLLYRLAQRDLGDRVAALAVFLLLTFPTALFLQSFYAEGLLLLFAVASFLAIRSGRLLIAGVLIALAALCKTYAMLLVVPLLVDYFQGRKWDWLFALRAGALLALPPIAAIAGWATYLGQRFGDPSLVVTAEDFWGRHLAPPWVASFDGLSNIRNVSSGRGHRPCERGAAARCGGVRVDTSPPFLCSAARAVCVGVHVVLGADVLGPLHHRRVSAVHRWCSHRITAGMAGAPLAGCIHPARRVLPRRVRHIPLGGSSIKVCPPRWWNW